MTGFAYTSRTGVTLCGNVMKDVCSVLLSTIHTIVSIASCGPLASCHESIIKNLGWLGACR